MFANHISLPQDLREPALIGCDRDLPQAQRAQEGRFASPIGFTSHILGEVLANHLTTIGILHQAGLPLDHVLLLPLQHDRCLDPRRIALSYPKTTTHTTTRGESTQL